MHFIFASQHEFDGLGLAIRPHEKLGQRALAGSWWDPRKSGNGVKMSLKSNVLCSTAGAALAFLTLVAPADASTLDLSPPNFTPGSYVYNSNSQVSPGNFSGVGGVTFSGTSGIEYNSSAWGFTTSPDGGPAAFLQAYHGDTAGSISFSVATVQGQSYNLTFDVEGRPNANGYSYGGSAFTTGASSVTKTFSSPSTSLWSLETLSFVANGGTTDFTIAIDYPSGSRAGVDLAIAVDNISVSATPLPPTWTLFIGGLAGFGFLAYRRSHRNNGDTSALAAA